MAQAIHPKSKDPSSILPLMSTLSVFFLSVSAINPTLKL